MKGSGKEYAELRGKLGQEAAWALAASELDYLREQNSMMTRVVRRLAREYKVEGDAIWARVDELVAEEARTIQLQAKVRKRFRLVLH
jgi:hypothetical protein